MNKSTLILLAVITAAIGLASSAVTFDFFVLGLQRLESDAVARDALVAAGLLMIATELAAFGLAALLPSTQLHALRGVLVACGFALLAFEGTTIYVTQSVLARNADTHAAGSETRIAQLRASIALQRAAAASLQVNGQAQSESSNAWTRQVGAKALGESVAITTRIEPLAAELAALESGKRATLTDVLGAEGVIWYGVARALLISAMGLVMFGAAGALLRASRGVTPAAPKPEAEARRFNPIPTGLKRAGPSIGWAIPAAALASISAPAMAQAVSLVATPAVDAPETVAEIEPGLKTEYKIESDSEYKFEANRGRYERVRAAVLAGEIKPSVLAVRGLERVGGEAAMGLLAQLAGEGVTVRRGRIWVLA
jgi:hypothetical protein